MPSRRSAVGLAALQGARRGAHTAPWIVIGILLAGLTAGSAHGASKRDAEAALSAGDRLYDAQDYSAALTSYREVLKLGYISPALLLNLGNAAYRIGEPGWAAYYYEQALRRSPSDPDIRSNLAQARRVALGDEPVPRGAPLLDRVLAMQNRLTLRGAVTMALLLSWLAVGLVVMAWLRAPVRWTRRLGWGALVSALIAVTLLSCKVAQGSLAAEALIVRPATAHAEPSSEATVEFRLPAASPVDLGRQVSGWQEVIVSSSLRGWVREEDVAPFSSPQ